MSLLQVKIFSGFILRTLSPVIKRAWTVHRVWSPVSFPILNQSVLYRKVRKVSFTPCNSYDGQRVGSFTNHRLQQQTRNIGETRDKNPKCRLFFKN
jgi:hypothetical protein